jgi:hypothetical protein
LELNALSQYSERKRKQVAEGSHDEKCRKQSRGYMEMSKKRGMEILYGERKRNERRVWESSHI